MDSPAPQLLRVGDWRVDSAAGQISRHGETVRLEARTLRLLMFLAERQGEVVSVEQLLDAVWSGVVVTQDSVYQGIASLRKTLGDDAKQPVYIANVPRLGYRLIAPVSAWLEPAAIAPAGPVMVRRSGLRGSVLLAAGALLGAAVLVTFLLQGKPSAPRPATAVTVPERSVAVLPFIDLTTQAMDKEYFADGMTEELIDRLSQLPDLKVPAAASSYFFKNKTLPLPEIAKSLGVKYLIDGSIRKAGNTLRVSARLLRADDGYVVWTESYDRLPEDELKVQDEIAQKVSKAMAPTIR
jgi:transcriptional activator of cad operon